MLGVELPPRVGEWLAELVRRPAVAAEEALVKTL
jgi:hypothetical protein